MTTARLGTFDRAQARTPAERGYVDSYLLIRTLVGLIGILLPFALVLARGVTASRWHVLGSISDYYHSASHDVFVGALTVIGILLVTYMAGTWNADFWASSVAGVFLLGVAYVPTDRSWSHARSCTGSHAPPGCAPVERWIGESTAAHIHYACAAIALSALAVIAFVFAWREREFASSLWLARLHAACGGAIVAGLAFTLLGSAVAGLTPLYAGEVVTVWAFGLGWLVKGYDLWRRLGRFVPRPRPAADPTG
jgi:Protein of unknown function (DUF998)